MATSEKKLIAVHCATFCPPPTLHCVGLNPQENATLWHFSFAGFLFANYGEEGGGGHCLMASDGCDYNNLAHTQNNLGTSTSESDYSRIGKYAHRQQQQVQNSIKTCRGQTTATSISLTSYQHRVPKQKNEKVCGLEEGSNQP